MGNRPGSFVLAAVVATYSAAGQQRHSPFSLRTGIDLVLVPVTLMDRRGASIGDLDQRHFTVFQDNSPQAIVSFSKENAPCTLAVVLDASESMLCPFRRFSHSSSQPATRRWSTRSPWLSLNCATHTTPGRQCWSFPTAWTTTAASPKPN